MRTFRRFVLIASVPALGFVPLAGGGSAAQATQGPGAAVADLQVVFDTPIPENECNTTTSTLSGSLDGAISLGSEVVAGSFVFDGAGAPWWPNSCEDALTGDTLFAAALTGTAVDGRAIACDLDVAIARSGLAYGLVRGTCSIDGVGSHAFGGTLIGATVTDPVTATGANGAPAATGYNFTAPFAQHDAG